MIQRDTDIFNSHDNSSAQEGEQAKQRWEPLKLEYLGTIDAMVQQGGGKVTIVTGDPGEFKKVPAHDTGG